MKRKVVLVQCSPQNGGQSGPPLGLISAARFLTELVDVELVDQRIHTDYLERLEKHCLDSQVLLFAFSFMPGGEVRSFTQIAPFIKKRTQTPILVGGVHASLLARETVKYDPIDMLLMGEGEHSFKELVRRMLAGEDLSLVPGLIYKKEGELFEGPAPQQVDMNTLTRLPLWEATEFSKYLVYFDGDRMVHFETSRGCTKSCNYCYNIPLFRSKHKFQNLELVKCQIHELCSRYDFDGFYLVDDNFFADKDRVMLLAQEFMKYGKTWGSQGAEIVDLLQYTREDFLFLSKSGLKRLNIGVETASTKLRGILNKKGTREDIETVVRQLIGTPIKISGNLMTNIPHETKEDLRETASFIVEMVTINPNVTFLPFAIWSPVLGTPLVDVAKKNVPGYNVPLSFEDWGNIFWSSHDLKPRHDLLCCEFLKEKDFLLGLFLTSSLFDKKMELYSKNLILITLAKLYRKIATFRLKNLYFGFFVEGYALKLAKLIF